jgi:hypothetical protein
LANATTGRATDPVITGPSCPDGYNGPTNLATGCPYYLMTYTVQYEGQAPVRCPPGWSPPAASGGSPGHAAAGCGGVATAN